MTMTMNFNDFIDQWPESRKDQFSYDGKKALFEYLEEYEESTGEQIEFDPIAICCDYTEFKNLKEAQEQYQNIKDIDDFRSYTQVITIDDNSFIIQNY